MTNYTQGFYAYQAQLTNTIGQLEAEIADAQRIVDAKSNELGAAKELLDFCKGKLEGQSPVKNRIADLIATMNSKDKN